MKPVIGVYLGWVSPDSHQWEPMYRTVRARDGYKSERTRLYAEAVQRYPGLITALDFHSDSSDLPFALRRRTPLVRPDYERDASTLNLPYPNLDIFEYIGRTGGLFSGDPFIICPFVEPNDDGSFSFESLLWKFDPEVRDALNETSQLKVIVRTGEPPIVTVNERVLGELLPNFALLEDTIFNVRLVRIGDKHYFGGGEILISFDTSLNLYQTPNFALTTPKVASV
jgi:hypothetical protein